MDILQHSINALEEGPKQGDILNGKKTVALLESCEGDDCRRQMPMLKFRELNLQVPAYSIIQMMFGRHMKVFSSQAASYGTVLYGVPFGSPEFITIWIQNKIIALQSEFPNAQGIFFLRLIFCAIKHITYCIVYKGLKNR